MERIFNFTNADTLYKRCILSTIAHNITKEKYPLIYYEKSWDGNNYLFNNSKGTRGVIAFSKGFFVCGIRFEKSYIKGEEKILENMLNGASDVIREQAIKKVLPYLWVEDNLPGISAICFGNNKEIFSSCSEKEFMERTDNVLLEYLYEENDAIRYLKEYYDMNDEEMALLKKEYEKSIM